MKIWLLGGFAVDHDVTPVDVIGAMQRDLLFRLALDPYSKLGYRAWPKTSGWIARPRTREKRRSPRPSACDRSSRPGHRFAFPGCWLAMQRGEVDPVTFHDLVAAVSGVAECEASSLTSEAL